MRPESCDGDTVFLESCNVEVQAILLLRGSKAQPMICACDPMTLASEFLVSYFGDWYSATAHLLSYALLC